MFISCLFLLCLLQFGVVALPNIDSLIGWMWLRQQTSIAELFQNQSGWLSTWQSSSLPEGRSVALDADSSEQVLEALSDPFRRQMLLYLICTGASTLLNAVVLGFSFSMEAEASSLVMVVTTLVLNALVNATFTVFFQNNIQ